MEDVRLFDGLREHAGWRRLYEVIRQRKARTLDKIAARQMGGEEVTQREIDFTRGFYAGALWIIERPEKAEAELELAARMAYMRAAEDLETAEEGESPYA